MAASAEESARWYSYFYEGSDVLRNKLEIRDGDRLEEAERFLSDRRYDQILAGRIRIPRTYDLEHVKAIHGALFQDVYPFAGQLRTVVIGKKITETEPARVFLSPGRPGEVWMGAVAETIRDRDWSSLGRAEAVEAFADLYTNVNFGHFFREGSGRTGRLFLEHVAELSPYRLDYATVDPERWNRASAHSIYPRRTRPSAGPLDYAPLRAVFQDVVVTGTPVDADAIRAAEVRRLMQASFPRPSRPNAPAAATSRPFRAGSLGQDRGSGYSR